LRDLGLDQWFADRALEQCDPDLSIARVTAVERGGYLVHGEQGEIPAELTGRLQFVAGGSTDLPTVGDWVCVRDRDGGTQANIHAVLPRRSSLRRKVPGKDIDFQLIAANIDVAFVIQACHFDFNVRRLERYLVMVREGGIEPVVLLTKTDLVSAAELQDLVGRIRDAGIDARIITLSNVTGAGLDEVRGLLVPGRTYCLLGSVGSRQVHVDQPARRRRCAGRRRRTAGRRRAPDPSRQPHGRGPPHDYAPAVDRTRRRRPPHRHARHARARHDRGQQGPR